MSNKSDEMLPRGEYRGFQLKVSTLPIEQGDFFAEATNDEGDIATGQAATQEEAIKELKESIDILLDEP